MQMNITVNTGGGRNFIANAMRRPDLAEQARKASALFHTVVCAANDIADTEMRTAAERLADTQWWYHGVKQSAGTAIRRAKDCYQAMYKALNGREQAITDYLDEIGGKVDADIMKLRMAFKQELDYQKQEDAEIKALTLSAYALVTLSVDMFDMFFDKIRERVKTDIRAPFLSMRMNKALAAWRDVVRRVMGGDGCYILDEHSAVKLAVEVIATKLNDLNVITNCAKEAVELNKLKE